MDALHRGHRCGRMILAAAAFLALPVVAQPIDISGVVKDEFSGMPLEGFVVRLAAKGLTDTTDVTGKFHLYKAATRLADKSPLQRLVYHTDVGFALRLTKDEEVTAEIRNGAGRTLVHGYWEMQAGDWSLKPKNLEPGLYTVMLWTGSRLRALRLNIPETGKERGKPQWTVAELTPAESAEALAPPLGVVVDSLRLEGAGYAPHRVAVQSWSQGGITILPRRLPGGQPGEPAAK